MFDCKSLLSLKVNKLNLLPCGNKVYLRVPNHTIILHAILTRLTITVIFNSMKRLCSDKIKESEMKFLEKNTVLQIMTFSRDLISEEILIRVFL